MYPHERSLVKTYAGRPFAIVGINSDRNLDRLKPVLKKQNITWRSFWNGPRGTGGPISRRWNVTAWPTLYLLDHEGVIRFRGHRVPDTLLADLVKSAESPSAKPGR